MDGPSSSANGVPGAGGRRSVRSDVDEFGWQLDRMGPLLRDMVAFGIVVRDEHGVFVLHEEVQRRLAASSSRLNHPATAAVFVGRSCQRCGASGVTRLVEGARLCAACQSTPAVVAVVVDQAPAGHEHHRRWRLRPTG
jgi:hypothetical protein